MNTTHITLSCKRDEGNTCISCMIFGSSNEGAREPLRAGPQVREAAEHLAVLAEPAAAEAPI